MACLNCGSSSGRHMRLCVDCTIDAEKFTYVEDSIRQCETLEDIKECLIDLLPSILKGEDLTQYLWLDQQGISPDEEGYI